MLKIIVWQNERLETEKLHPDFGHFLLVEGDGHWPGLPLRCVAYILEWAGSF